MGVYVCACVFALNTERVRRSEQQLTDLFPEPPPRKGGGKVEDVDGMIAKLRELGAI